MHEIRRELWVPRPIGEVFEFFSRAENLEKLTPPLLGFQILTPQPIEMKVGAHILYRLRVRGLPMRWLTEITEWAPPYRFADVQKKGPYRVWDHTHLFESKDGGTLITDLVRYELPLGPLGRLVHALLVERDVETIFEYRTKVIRELFP